MKQIRISQFSSLAISFGLLVGPLPMIAHEQVPADQDRQNIAVHLSEVELQEVFNNPKRSYFYIGNDVSDIANIVEEIIKFDDNKNSILWGLANHIKRGYVVSNDDAIREALAYAERLIAHKNHQISQDQLDKIENALDELAYQIENGDLTIQRCCDTGCDNEFSHDGGNQQDCSVSKLCCKGPRGPRGHRGHRGHTGNTGATGADGSTVTGANVGAGTGLIFRDKTGIFINFKTLIQSNHLTVTNNADDITLATDGTNLNTPNTLVARDGTGSFAAQVISMVDGVVSENIIISTEPSTATAGNVIKGTSRFIHDFGTNNLFVGIDAGNFTLTGTQNSGFGTNALTALTSGTGNTAIGYNTLPATTTGNNNTAVGDALIANVTGSDNTALGANTLNLNTESFNTAVGSSALAVSTTGINNTAVGYNALSSNISGSDNTAVGVGALQNYISGLGQNVAVGVNALNSNTGTGQQIAIGWNALASDTSSIFPDAGNVAVGYAALQANTDSYDNTAVGWSALTANTTGTDNTAVGTSAMFGNTTGIENTAMGSFALTRNTIGLNNTAVGYAALVSNITGSNATAVGHNALLYNTANGNTAVGSNALSFNTVGSGNTAVGSGAGFNYTSSESNNIIIGTAGVVADSNTIRIGDPVAHTTCFVQGINGVAVGASSTVLINAAGQLGTTVSSARFKHNIADMGELSADILKLRPVTFAYNSDASETTQYGLIAEEVDQVFPALVVRDADGQPQTVQYHVLPILLLNEVQKQQARLVAVEAQQHITVEQMNSAIAGLQAQMQQAIDRIHVLENNA